MVEFFTGAWCAMCVVFSIWCSLKTWRNIREIRRMNRQLKIERSFYDSFNRRHQGPPTRGMVSADILEKVE